MEEVSPLLAFTEGDAWVPGIGDPTVMGWLTVAAYFLTAVLCFGSARRAARIRFGRQTVLFWGILTGLLMFLGVNKQLDLQTLLTLTMRRVAIAQGWYENRRVLQVIFVLLIAIGGISSAIMMRGLVRQNSALWLPLAGFLLLLCFVVIRAASFHHVDQVINFRFGGVRMNWVLEIGAITLVAMGAWNRQQNLEERIEDAADDFSPAR